MPTAHGKLSIKTKLILLIFVTSFAVLILENIAFVVYERVQIQDNVARDMSAFARIISQHSAHAVEQRNKQETQDILNIAKVEKAIVAACIYDVQGEVVARYDSGAEREFAFPRFEDLSFTMQQEKNYLLLSEPIINEGVLIGNVFIRANLRELNLRWYNFLLYRALMVFIVSGVTLLIVFRLQRIISCPIDRLTSMVHAIVVNKNYRMRVPIERNDEIGALAHAFNGLLETIENRENALHQCNERRAHFEQKVSYPPDLLALSSLHIADGIEHIGGDVQAYRKQLQRFRKHFANALQELQRILYEEKDPLAATVYCNALKGVSGNIGAISLFRYVSHLAKDLRENRIPDEDDLKRLDLVLQEVFSDIDSLQIQEIKTVTLRPDFSAATLAVKIDELLVTLESDLGESEKRLAELCELAHGSEFEALAEAIAVQLDEFNIEQASLLLNDLKQRLTSASS